MHEVRSKSEVRSEVRNKEKKNTRNSTRLAHEFTPRGVKSLQPVLAGSGYGTALFLGADEVAVPALGLSQSDGASPLGAHLYGLVSHLVYGVTLEMVRKSVRQNL